MLLNNPTTIRIVWLSPEQPPDRVFLEEADRHADVQQQAALIRHYRKALAEKDDEIATLKAGMAQRHALIAQQKDEIARWKDEVDRLTTVVAQLQELAQASWEKAVYDALNAPTQK